MSFLRLIFIGAWPLFILWTSGLSSTANHVGNLKAGLTAIMTVMFIESLWSNYQAVSFYMSQVITKSVLQVSDQVRTKLAFSFTVLNVWI